MDQDLEAISKKLDVIAERIRIYQTEETGYPTVGLLLSGVRSSLEDIIHHLRDGETKLDRAMNTLSEMKSILGENTANVRSLRNRFYCIAGEKEVNAEFQKLANEEKESKKSNEF